MVQCVVAGGGRVFAHPAARTMNKPRSPQQTKAAKSGGVSSRRAEVVIERCVEIAEQVKGYALKFEASALEEGQGRLTAIS
jgi:hypothetical protein